MIRLSLLGAVDLCGRQDLRAVLAQPKRLALLAYVTVATPRAFHSRDTILALLWPELDQHRSRAALRQSLYALRRTLGEDAVVTVGDCMVGVDHTRLWCDVIAFEQAIANGTLDSAAELYGGELLSGFHIAGITGFARWLEDERARLQSRAAQVLWSLCDRDEHSGQLTAALGWARRLMVLTPDDERAVRRVIALLDRLGDRASAIRTYHEFARRLAADYAMDPASETQALISSIRAPSLASGLRSAVHT